MNSPAVSSPKVKMPERIARGLASVTAALLILMVIQQFFGLGLFRTFEIAPGARISPADQAFRWTLPRHYHGDLINTAGVVLEDGKAVLNRARHSSEVRTRGRGWYAFNAGKIWFSPSDGSDPRTNGRKYQVRLPLQWDDDLRYWVGGLLILSLIWLRACRASLKLPDVPEHVPVKSPPVVRKAALIFLGSLCFAILRVLSEPGFTDGSMTIKGMPESDAIGWHEIANGLVDGHGLTTVFESQRPLYSVMLVPVYWLLGGSVMAGKMINCAALAAAVTGMWMMGMILRARPARWMAGAALLFSLEHESLTQAILTENGGMCFSVLALLGAWLALRLRSPLWGFMAGFVNGIGNLASGVTLLSLPLYAMLMLFHSLRNRASGWRSLLLVATFTAGASVVIVPWMIRQKVTHGHLTISINNAELLYGGAHPVYGRFCSEVQDEATKDGIDPNDSDKRYTYYSKKFVTLVTGDPLRYMRQVLGAAVASFSYFHVHDPAYRTAGLLALLITALVASMRGGGVSRLIAAAALAIAWLNLDQQHTAVVALAALAVSYWKARSSDERIMLTLLALTILALALAGGIAGNVAMRRFWLAGDWTLVLLTTVGLVRAVEAAGDAIDALLARFKHARILATEPPVGESSDPRMIEPCVKAGVGGAGLYAAISVILACAFTALGPASPFPGAAETNTAGAIDTLRQKHPGKDKLQTSPALKTIIARLDDLVMPMRAGEEFGSWQSRYDRREYDHTVCFIRPLDPKGNRSGHQPAITSSSVKDVPRGVPLLWMGIMTNGRDRLDKSSVPILEVLGVVPLDHGASNIWTPNYSRALWFDPTPESLQR